MALENISMVKVFSIDGKKLLTFAYQKNREYDLSNLNKGIYIIHLSDNFGLKATQKLIIQ